MERNLSYYGEGSFLSIILKITALLCCKISMYFSITKERLQYKKTKNIIIKRILKKKYIKKLVAL
nr:MAG TPA: hypothetical protein [Caudoviricetes sp.]